MCDLQKTVQVFLFAGLLVFSGPISAQPETYYKYVDENGTMVITQTLGDVPEDQREAMKEVNFPKEKETDENLKSSFKIESLREKKIVPLKEIVNAEKISTLGKKAVHQAKNVFFSFIEDQKTLLIAYVVSGIVIFFIISKLLKRFVGGFVTKIIMKLGIVIVIFSGVYLLYLSWLSETVLSFNSSEDSSEKNIVDQITTPQEILQQAQDVVDQLNKTTKQRETLLNGMDGS